MQQSILLFPDTGDDLSAKRADSREQTGFSMFLPMSATTLPGTVSVRTVVAVLEGSSFQTSGQGDFAASGKPTFQNWRTVEADPSCIGV